MQNLISCATYKLESASNSCKCSKYRYKSGKSGTILVNGQLTSFEEYLKVQELLFPLKEKK